MREVRTCEACEAVKVEAGMTRGDELDTRCMRGQGRGMQGVM